MKNITKKLLVAGALAAMTLPLIGLAQTPTPIPERNLSYGDIIRIIDNIANILFGLMVAVSVFYVLWAAWEYMNGKVDEAKPRLLNAGIALAIGLLSKLLPKVVFALLGNVV
jgi:hypothetical protein